MVLLRARQKSGVEQLLERVRPYLPEDRLSLVEEAYRFAETCHAGQTRKSGDPYIVHPLDAAMTCADLQLDAAAVAADRLHNMRTLEYLAPEKQRRVAQETMEIYAPLASRLGIWQIKWELENLAFKHLEPERYDEVSRLIAANRTARERYIAQVEKIGRTELEKQGVEATVQGRAKHAYSVYQKIQKYAAQGKTFNEIYDLLALRVLVNTVSDCYAVLGTGPGLWGPNPAPCADYTA